jgi:hypothetical protein
MTDDGYKLLHEIRKAFPFSFIDLICKEIEKNEERK